MQREINVCIDLTATPYYLGRMGNATNTVFPWVVSDFGLTDAIESGLVKVPQLVARDGTGAVLPTCFNVWAWMQMAAMLNQGKPSARSPGGLFRADLAAFHREHREQQLYFQMGLR
jgi:type III restriction enzyme